MWNQHQQYRIVRFYYYYKQLSIILNRGSVASGSWPASLLLKTLKCILRVPLSSFFMILRSLLTKSSLTSFTLPFCKKNMCVGYSSSSKMVSPNLKVFFSSRLAMGTRLTGLYSCDMKSGCWEELKGTPASFLPLWSYFEATAPALFNCRQLLGPAPSNLSNCRWKSLQRKTGRFGEVPAAVPVPLQSCSVWSAWSILCSVWRSRSLRTPILASWAVSNG